MRFLFSAKGVPEVVKLKSFPPVAGIRNKYFRGISPSFLKAYLGSASQHDLHKSSLSIELILDLDSQEPLRWHSGKKKNPLGNAGDARDAGSIPWSGRFPWSRKWQPTPVFLPEKFQG